MIDEDVLAIFKNPPADLRAQVREGGVEQVVPRRRFCKKAAGGVSLRLVLLPCLNLQLGQLQKRPAPQLQVRVSPLQTRNTDTDHRHKNTKITVQRLNRGTGGLIEPWTVACIDVTRFTSLMDQIGLIHEHSNLKQYSVKLDVEDPRPIHSDDLLAELVLATCARRMKRMREEATTLGGRLEDQGNP